MLNLRKNKIIGKQIGNRGSQRGPTVSGEMGESLLADHTLDQYFYLRGPEAMLKSGKLWGSVN